ncbi:MAG TPA: aminotransferase class V-fold PLP-dependent enzyme [Polyangia bacterium]|nr:aminotransferase class V-fold PLP-dependent enzyme [Polyangia bacterium]
MSGLDLPSVRRQFPALAEQEGDWVFFDNAGGSQILGRVVERIVEFLRTSNVQLGGSYAPSRLAAERVAEGARSVAALLNARSPDEIVLGPSTTQLLDNLALAMRFAAGDEIVVTNCDHESNIGAWRRLAERGVVLREWKLDRDSLSLNLDALTPLLTHRTRLVCFTHASNVLGTIHPVAEITRAVHAAGAQVCVDGVAYAPHRPVDVQAWDVDYYVFSLYKVFGPHQAVLYGKRDHLLSLANLNHYFIGDHEIPYKLQPGNVNYELTWSLTAIKPYLDDLGPAAIAEHEERLASRLLDYLRHKRDVRIIGLATADRATRVPTISFTVENRHSAEIPPAIDAHHLGIKSGDFYARRLIESLGLQDRGGVIRVSMVHYNTVEEVDRLIRALDSVL